MAEESSSRLTISLPRYDGPFDVLISLIRRNEWSIDDLPVLEITRQFLAHIQAAEDMDAELGGEFVETASWLVLLKSRSMLPGEANEPLPKDELRRAVLDHATLRAATDLLRGGYDRNVYPGRDGALPAGRKDRILPVSLDDAPTVVDVLARAREAVAVARAASSFSHQDTQGPTVEQQFTWIRVKLAEVPINTAVDTAQWFADQTGDGARAALLLALLELTRRGFVLLNQAHQAAPIRIKALCEVPADIQVEEPAFALTA
jgi:chromatin segregation and condensation protein Rec8/ScpA/Scc1 (kleisin family)